MTTQWSSIESWRQDVKEEDRRVTGAAVGSLKTPLKTYKELRKAATNTRASSIGNGSVVYEDRVFLLLYFPDETSTPPCYMFFPKTMLVGKVCDRVGAMLNLPRTTQPVLVRLKTHQSPPMSNLMGDLQTPPHEEFVVTLNGSVPDYFPPPKSTGSEDKPPEEEEEPPQVPEPEQKPQEEPECVVEGGTAPPEGFKPWADLKFINKKYQPAGDKNTPAGKRLQFAVFILHGGRQKAIYMYFNKDWVCGRLADTALQAASVPNPNLSTTDPMQKLVPFNLRTLAPLPPSTPLSETGAKSGDGILIATAAGIPAWCAAEAAQYTAPEPAFEKEAKKKLRECVVQ